MLLEATPVGSPRHLGKPQGPRDLVVVGPSPLWGGKGSRVATERQMWLLRSWALSSKTPDCEFSDPQALIQSCCST